MNMFESILDPIMDSTAPHSMYSSHERAYMLTASSSYVRYTTDDSKTVVNSDRFTLTHMNGRNHSQFFNEYHDHDEMSHGSGGPPVYSNVNPAVLSTRSMPISPYASGSNQAPTQAGTLRPSATNSVLPSVTSLLDSSSSINQATPQAGGSIGPIGTLPTPTIANEPTRNRSGAMSLSRQRDSALKKISLLLWPVMVGALMAV
jgi:hypothetical protein